MGEDEVFCISLSLPSVHRPDLKECRLMFCVIFSPVAECLSVTIGVNRQGCIAPAVSSFFGFTDAAI